MTEILKYFKLQTTIATSNFVLFNQGQQLVRYNSSKQILEEFYEARILFYSKRKGYMISKLQREVQIIENKVKFIKCINGGQLKIQNLKKIEIIKNMENLGFVKQQNLVKIQSTMVQGEEGAEAGGDSDLKQYNYLLQMAIYSLSHDQITLLEEQLKDKLNKMQLIEEKTEK